MIQYPALGPLFAVCSLYTPLPLYVFQDKFPFRHRRTKSLSSFFLHETKVAMSSDQTHLPSLPSNMEGASKPINDTFFHRFWTLLAIKLFGRPQPHGRCHKIMLTDRVCVKCGPDLQLSEASTMRFISQNTSIPVPKVYCAFTRKGMTYIVMEKMKGDVIAKDWFYRSEESKMKLLAQLRKMILELRQLKPPEATKIGSVDGGPLWDDRIPRFPRNNSASTPVADDYIMKSPCGGCFGPFDTVEDFHRHLRAGDNESFDNHIRMDVIKRQNSKFWPLVFTHGDLSS